MGDRSEGYHTHTYGCQLLARYKGEFKGQWAVLCSRPVVREFMQVMKGESYELEIIGG